jgi:hypothetical protein
MRFVKAKKLQNGDEVKIKDNNEIVKVIKTEIYNEDKYIKIYVQSSEYGYIAYFHTDIE